MRGQPLVFQFHFKQMVTRGARAHGRAEEVSSPTCQSPSLGRGMGNEDMKGIPCSHIHYRGFSKRCPLRLLTFAHREKCAKHSVKAGPEEPLTLH